MISFEAINHDIMTKPRPCPGVAMAFYIALTQVGVREYHNLGEAKVHFECLRRAVNAYCDEVQKLGH